ncbi:hypothetical protein GCM10010169_40920 [Micromonospora fulviviridis]|nr:hypothetical protein GCM10010169_40920 [Micromonospora fulviviridis]
MKLAAKSISSSAANLMIAGVWVGGSVAGGVGGDPALVVGAGSPFLSRMVFVAVVGG